MTVTKDHPTFADETAVRALYARLLQAWELGADAYAECFTQDATYIIANGMIEQGWQEIVEGHRIIFSAWARNSALEGRIDSIRFLSPEIALVIAGGRIVFKDHRSSDGNKRTVYSLIAGKTKGEWKFVFYQNTPIEKH